MFGPSEINLPMYGATHHRSGNFQDLCGVCRKLFRQVFDIPTNYEIHFVTGSGTLAIETVLASWDGDFRPSSDEGEFNQRLRTLAQAWACRPPKPISRVRLYCFCPYETASARRVETRVTRSDMIYFHDLVSGFPYYRPDAHVDVWVTVTGKQLGVDPGLAVVVFNERFASHIRGDLAGSELSLADRRSFACKNETPHTPAIGLFGQLRDKLRDFNPAAQRAWIDRRRSLIERALLPHKPNLGEGPVVTFPRGSIDPELASNWNLYQGRKGPQVFLWSGSDRNFAAFVADLQRTIR